MRALTEAEGRVIAVLLGGADAPEREKLRRIQVPRSTYHAARRRAYEEGWLKDRYVPDPARFGRPIVSFLVVRPFVDRTAELVAAWQGAPANVLTWESPQVALGVFFHSTLEDAERASQRLAPSEWSRWSYILHSDVSGPTVPVFFDYEGLWSHLADVPGTNAYPGGLGGALAGHEGEVAPISEHQRWASSELVHRPFVAQAAGRAGHLVGPLGLPFSQLRMLKLGWVAHRVFLDPAQVPPFRGRAADQLTLIVGALRPEARPEALFATLTRECRVFPFLYANGGGRMLIGAMGRSPDAPPEARPPESRRPVLQTLQSSLQGIEILNEPASAFRTLVDHRYDRMFPRSSRT